MIDSESACPWGRENRAGQGRRAKFMHECMDEPEDAGPAKICSGIQGCGGLESVIYPPIGALGSEPQKIWVPSMPIRCTPTTLRTIDFAVAVPTPTGPPDAV